jgi:hypothetical protein
MKPLKLLLTIITVMLVSQQAGHLIAQETQNKLSLEKGTIANRFDFVIKEATVVDDGRVVKSWWLTRLKSHVSDTIKELHNQIALTQQLIVSRNAQIDSLVLALQEVKNNLSTIEKEKGNIRLIGISLSKNVYKTILWTIVAILSILLVLFILLFQRSNLVTRKANSSMEELRAEFDTYKKTAREREEKISVNYLREINKLKERKI